VLYVAPYAHLGGAERVTLDLLTLHDRSVVEPSVCFLRDGPLVETCRALGVPTFLLPGVRMRDLLAMRRTVRALTDIVRATSADLVHSVGAWAHCLGGPAGRRCRRPAVWWQHGGASWRHWLDVRAALTRATMIIANSDFTAGVQHRVNPRRVPIRTVHYGTRLPVEPRERRRGRGRSRLGIADGEFCVGIVARLEPWKGQDVVIRAAASLLHARPNTRLFVIGDVLFTRTEAYAASLRDLAAQLGVADRVVFTGHRDDVGDCLAALDVAVHASTSPEPFGLALIEAMAAGTPIVAARGGATPEIVTTGVDGLLLPPGQSEELATALLALHDDPDRRRAFAEAADATVRERFEVSQMVRRVEDLYRGLVPG